MIRGTNLLHTPAPRHLVCLGCLLLLLAVFMSAQEQQTAGDSVQLEPLKTKKADYPLVAIRDGIQGQVWLQVLISENGDVERIDVLSGDPVLATAAVSACKKWKFKPFIRNGKAVKTTTKIPFDFYFSEKKIEGKVSADGSTAIDAPGRVASGPAAVPDAAADTAPKRVRLAQGVQEGMLIHKIAPVYPESARREHIQGTVILQAVIGKDGRIRDLHPISGPKELIPAAIGAVQQWRYKPYVFNGEPVEVETQITVNFQLRH